MPLNFFLIVFQHAMINCFSLKLAQNRIPLSVNLRLRGVNVHDITCPLCLKDEDRLTIISCTVNMLKSFGQNVSAGVMYILGLKKTL